MNKEVRRHSIGIASHARTLPMNSPHLLWNSCASQLISSVPTPVLKCLLKFHKHGTTTSAGVPSRSAPSAEPGPRPVPLY
eukprot:1491293-Pyramimonas_sp.AAC.1